MDLYNVGQLILECQKIEDPEIKSAFLQNFLIALESLPEEEQVFVRRQSQLRILEHLAKASRILDRWQPLRRSKVVEP